jgi:pilus assembly protein CpaC
MKKPLICLFILFSAIILNAKNLVFLTTAVPYKVRTSPHNKVWVQNKNILQTKDYGKYLIFQGKAKGTSKVQIGENIYTFIVGSKEEKDSYQRLKGILRFSPNLQLDYEKEKFIVGGTLREASEWRALRSLNLINWQLKTDMPNSVLLELQQQLNIELKAKNSPSMEIYSSPFPTVRVAKIFITENSRSLEIIKMYGLNIIIDNDVITAKPLIRIKMTLLEIRKSSLTEIGISPPNQFKSQLSPSGRIEGGAWGPELSLNLIESRGMGQILASPVLLTKSGSEAEFLAGGEIPIRVVSQRNKDLIWKKYGINLKVKPTADNQGHIKMDIETEVSNLDPNRTVDGIPAILTNKIQSHFELQKSQTLILSGLIKHINGETINGWPWLSDIPILGALFSSADFQQEKTEMVIMVTPEIVTN